MGEFTDRYESLRPCWDYFTLCCTLQSSLSVYLFLYPNSAQILCRCFVQIYFKCIYLDMTYCQECGRVNLGTHYGFMFTTDFAMHPKTHGGAIFRFCSKREDGNTHSETGSRRERQRHLWSLTLSSAGRWCWKEKGGCPCVLVKGRDLLTYNFWPSSKVLPLFLFFLRVKITALIQLWTACAVSVV